jgi:phosphoribosylanthranilate isomerase
VRTQIKICCMSSIEDVHHAIKAGADAVGFVCAIPTSARTIDINIVESITSKVEPSKDTFLLTSEKTAEEIAEKALLAGVNTVQILSYLGPHEYERLQKLLPNIKFVQVVHIENESSLNSIEAYGRYVHAFLLDSGKPNSSIPEYGGTGRTHDWSISAKFVQRTTHPVFLAGGLTPDNVGEAIKAVRPYGVDLCSGVRTNNALDHYKLEKFIKAVRATDAQFSEGSA